MKKSWLKKIIRFLSIIFLVIILFIGCRFYYKRTFGYAQRLCEARVKENIDWATFWDIKASNNLKSNHNYPFSEYFKEKVREVLWKDDFSYGFSIMREILWENSDKIWNYYCIVLEWKIIDFSIPDLK